MPPFILTALASVAWFGALAWALTRTAARTDDERSPLGYWLVCCLLSSLGYVALSLRLDAASATAVWLDGLRWGLFGVALYTFIRYRMARRGDP
ncbi:MAG: hypothetical protein AAGA23_15310 [Pseudomonadota bacterium]